MAEPTSSSSSAGPSTAGPGGPSALPSSSAPPLSPTFAAPDGPPPPTYAAMQPQMLIVPLPDAPSFFWGRTLQGEVYVKGLGEDRTQSVASLTVTARLTDRAAGLPDVEIGSVPAQTVYPPARGDASTSAPSAPSGPDVPFPTSHRFALDLPVAMPDGEPLPGSLDLGAGGAIAWTLEARLTLLSGEVLTEKIGIEGTPPDTDVSADTEDAEHESVAKLEQEGVCVRLVLACARPRLGDMVHIGVEVRPKGRERTGLAGLVAQPDPNETLRPLRRVRVELLRMVDVAAPPEGSSATGTHTVTTILHASGKSLRFPGMGQRYPPLRVLFTLPTAQLHPGMLATGGEISTRTPYHTVRFAVRATLGFGVVHETAAPGSPDLGNPSWTVEQQVSIRPPAWIEPPALVIEGDLTPERGLGGSSAHPDASPEEEYSEEEAREAYRRKGRDVVGASGTIRGETSASDAPPPFDDEAGPSGTHSEAPEEAGLPTFTESEAQMRSGEAPRLQSAPESAPLVPMSFEDAGFSAPEPAPEAATTNNNEDSPSPRRPSLRGELATWQEYDGYETFSMAPPPLAASFGVQGSMDPPRDEDPHEHAVAGDIAARLGLQGSPVASNPAALMEQLGLGHGRVVDLHDDLPPGIDEPSLPALPGFGDVSNVHHGNVRNYGQGYSGQQFGAPQFMDPFSGQQAAPDVEVDHPPSFDASEAAEAVGGVARSRVGSIRLHGTIQISAQSNDGDAPPGYFGSVNSAGPPAYGS